MLKLREYAKCIYLHVLFAKIVTYNSSFLPFTFYGQYGFEMTLLALSRPLSRRAGLHQLHIQRARFSTTKLASAAQVGHSTAIAQSDINRERVIILGSGWGGYSFSRRLSPDSFSPLIISPRSYFVFTPLLTDAASGALDFSNIVEPVRDSKAKVDFIQAAARAVDFNKKTVLCESTVIKSGVTESPRTHEDERLQEEGPETTSYRPMTEARRWEQGEMFEVPYDKLVIAVGAVSKTFKTPGVRHNAMFFKDIGDARRVKRRVRECFELAVLPTTSLEMRKHLLHFAIVGAGPTGTELAANLRDYIYQEDRKSVV